MSFITFLEEKISLILYQISFLIITTMIFLMADIQKFYIAITVGVLSVFMLGYLLSEYFRQKKKTKKIISLVDNVSEKYLISEIIKEPLEMENKAYYYALKQACKSMNDRIGELEKENTEYQEYVESFVHEIKTPISALSLALENNNDFRLKQEVDKINQLVEQMLYYARSENVEKDYIIKECNLKDIISKVIKKNKEIFILEKIEIKLEKLENKKVLSDSKWLEFIINQIISNSLKYVDKEKSIITISAIENEKNIILKIQDNGIGIPKPDIKKVFDKSFTGENGRKIQTSTGMGLYIAKQLCKKLGHKIEIESEQNEYTSVYITFNKNEFYDILK